jgi:serine/threonine-protein kinase HipA
MGRPSYSRTLTIWMNGRRVGRWTLPRTGPPELAYDPAWVASAEGRPLSLSLPFNLDGLPITGEKVGFYFDNLLPESEALRRRIRSRFRTPSGDPFDLLAAVGRDCVGAVQLLPEGDEPEGVFEIRAEPLDEEAVERYLLAATGDAAPLGGREDDDFRISLAGAQEKTALTWHRKRFCKPHGSTPTTHILKLPLGLVGAMRADMRASVENEWLCAQILRAYGIPVANCEIRTFGKTKASLSSASIAPCTHHASTGYAFPKKTSARRPAHHPHRSTNPTAARESWPSRASFKGRRIATRTSQRCYAPSSCSGRSRPPTDTPRTSV